MRSRLFKSTASLLIILGFLGLFFSSYVFGVQAESMPTKSRITQTRLKKGQKQKFQGVKDGDYPPTTTMTPDQIKNTTDSTIAVYSMDEFNAAMFNAHITHIFIAGNFNNPKGPSNAQVPVPTRPNLTVDGEVNSSNNQPGDGEVAGPTIDMNTECYNFASTGLNADGKPAGIDQVLPVIHVNNLNVKSGNVYGLFTTAAGSYGNYAEYHNYSFTGNQAFVNYGGLLVLSGRVRINQCNYPNSYGNGSGGEQIDESAALWIKDNTDLKTTFSYTPGLYQQRAYFEVAGWGDEHWYPNQPETINPNTGKPFNIGQLAIGNNANINMDASLDVNGGGHDNGNDYISGFSLGHASDPDSFSIGNGTAIKISTAPNMTMLTSRGYPWNMGGKGGLKVGNSSLNLSSAPVPNNQFDKKKPKNAKKPSLKSYRKGNVFCPVGEGVIITDGSMSFNGDPNNNKSILNIKENVGPKSYGTTFLYSQYPGGYIDLSKVGYANMQLTDYWPVYQGRRQLVNPTIQALGGQIDFAGQQLINVWNLSNPDNSTIPPTYSYKVGQPGQTVQWDKDQKLFNPPFNPSTYSRIQLGAGAVTGHGTIKAGHALNNAVDSTDSTQINGNVTDSNGKPVENAYVSIKGNPNITPNTAGNSEIPNNGKPFGDGSDVPQAVKEGNFVAKTDGYGNYQYKMPVINGKQTHLEAGENITAQAFADDGGPGNWFDTNVISQKVADMGDDPVINPYQPETINPSNGESMPVPAGDQVTGSNNPSENNAPALLRLDAVPQTINFEADPKSLMKDTVNNKMVLQASQDGTSLAYNPNNSPSTAFAQFTNHNNNIRDWNLTVSASSDGDDNSLKNATLDLGNGMDNNIQELAQDQLMKYWSKVGQTADTQLAFNQGAVNLASNNNINSNNNSGIFQALFSLNNIKLNVPTNDMYKDKLGLGGPAKSVAGTLTWTLTHGPQNG